MTTIVAILLAAAASNLNATDETLTATTTSTSATDVTVNYIEFVTATGAPADMGEQVTNFTTATTSTILAAPSASNTRAPSLIRACNKGTASQSLTIQYAKTAGSLSVRQVSASLAPGECLTWGNDNTATKTGSNGAPRVGQDAVGYSGKSFAMAKVATAIDTIGYHYLLNKDNGSPGAWSVGTPGVNGVATACDVVGTAGTGGALSLGSPILPDPATGGWYLTRFGLNGVVANTYQLLDVVWYNTGLTVTTTTAQAITTPTLPARDLNGSSNGEGYEIALYALTALGNAAAVANSTVTYTNSAGTGSRTATFSGSVGFQAPATPVIGTWMPFQLQAGDTGVRSIQSITLTTTYTSGTMMLVIYRPIALDGVSAANFPSGSLVSRAQLNPGVRVWNDTCFAVAVLGAPATTAPSFTAGIIELMER